MLVGRRRYGVAIIAVLALFALGAWMIAAPRTVEPEVGVTPPIQRLDPDANELDAGRQASSTEPERGPIAHDSLAIDELERDPSLGDLEAMIREGAGFAAQLVCPLKWLPSEVRTVYGESAGSQGSIDVEDGVARTVITAPTGRMIINAPEYEAFIVKWSGVPDGGVGLCSYTPPGDVRTQLVGRLVGPDGAPVSGADVWGCADRATADEDGRFVLQPPTSTCTLLATAVVQVDDEISVLMQSAGHTLGITTGYAVDVDVRFIPASVSVHSSNDKEDWTALRVLPSGGLAHASEDSEPDTGEPQVHLSADLGLGDLAAAAAAFVYDR